MNQLLYVVRPNPKRSNAFKIYRCQVWTPEGGIDGPEVNIRGGGRNLYFGDTKARVRRQTDFGAPAKIGQAVTRTFTIENLPAGEYVLETWHEVYGTMTQTITIGDGETATIDFAYSGDGDTS